MIKLERFQFPLLLLFMLTGNQALVADEAMIKEGAQIYAQNCVFCHQADAIGKPGFAPSLSNPEFLSIASDKFLLSTIRDGTAGYRYATLCPSGARQGACDRCLPAIILEVTK